MCVLQTYLLPYSYCSLVLHLGAPLIWCERRGGSLRRCGGVALLSQLCLEELQKFETVTTCWF